MSFALFVSYGFSIIFISLSADFIITYSGRAKTITGIANTAVKTPLMFIAITIFNLSDAEEINITGTFDIFLILLHQ